jgi:hypothetical protein
VGGGRSNLSGPGCASRCSHSLTSIGHTRVHSSRTPPSIFLSRSHARLAHCVRVDRLPTTRAQLVLPRVGQGCSSDHDRGTPTQESSSNHGRYHTVTHASEIEGAGGCAQCTSTSTTHAPIQESSSTPDPPVQATVPLRQFCSVNQMNQTATATESA